MAPSTSPACCSSSARANRRSKSSALDACARAGAAIRTASSKPVATRNIGMCGSRRPVERSGPSTPDCSRRRRKAARHDALGDDRECRKNSEEENRWFSSSAVHSAASGEAGSLEVVLQDELNDAVSALEVDLAEVVLRLLRVVKPLGWIADRRCGSGAIGGWRLHATGGVERQVDVAADEGVGKRLVEDVEEPDPNLEFLVAGDAEVLEQRQVVIGPHWRSDVIRRHQRTVRSKLRHGDAVQVEDLLSDRVAAQPGVAGIDRR